MLQPRGDSDLRCNCVFVFFFFLCREESEMRYTVVAK
uniref:Uncharacterized protein n=1 Tax=Anguilla anguilla TaxID=7936 RepID=A0A0E9WPM6_ANGAN